VAPRKGDEGSGDAWKTRGGGGYGKARSTATVNTKVLCPTSSDFTENTVYFI